MARKSAVFDDYGDEEIIKYIHRVIYSAASAYESPFECFPVFLIVKNILKRSSEILNEEIGEGRDPAEEMTHVRVPTVDYSNVTLPELQQINEELTSFDENQTEPMVSARRATLRIMKKLKHHSCDTMAVLSLLAFAMQFRGFRCPLSDIRPRANQNVALLSLAILGKDMQANGVFKRIKLLIMTALQVTGTLIKLRKLSSVYDERNHASQASTDALAIHSYWVIMTTVACTSQIMTITLTLKDEQQDALLRHCSEKLNHILDSLKNKLNKLNEKNGEARLYWDVVEVSTAPRNITEVLQAMYMPGKLKLHDCAALFQRMENFEPIMRGKTAFFFISRINISEDDISLMKQTQKKVDEDGNSNFQIVWIPFSEEFDQEAKELLKKKRKKMTWYDLAVSSNSKALAMKYIREEWHYQKDKTMLVVMNKDGLVENFNAYELLRRWGMEAFPFDKKAERGIAERVMNWPRAILSDLGVSKVERWMKYEKRYTFLFGGRDDAWTKAFQTRLEKISGLIKGNAEINWFGTGDSRDKDNKGRKDNTSSKFWTVVEEWFSKIEDYNRGTFKCEIEQIRMLLTFEYQEGWFLLCQGPRPVMSGQGKTMLDVLINFESHLRQGYVTLDHNKSSSFGEAFGNSVPKTFKKHSYENIMRINE